MISADNKNMQEAGETLFALNANDHIRDLCEAREDYRRTWDSVKLDMEEKDTVIREKDSRIAELKLSNEKKDSRIAELKLSNEKKDSRITSLEAQIAKLQRQLQNSMN